MLVLEQDLREGLRPARRCPDTARNRDMTDDEHNVLGRSEHFQSLLRHSHVRAYLLTLY
jgi:hypothetical protein